MKFDYGKLRKEYIDKTILKGNSIVLDIGCGDGHMFKEYENVIGIDADGNSMVGNPNKTIKLDVVKKRLPFDNDSVDQIFCLEFLEHLEKIENIIKIIKEFNKVLKVNGSLIIHTPNRNRLTLKLRNLIGKPKKYPFSVDKELGYKYRDFHYWEFTKDEINKLLTDYGFVSKIDEIYLNPAIPMIHGYGIGIKTRYGRGLFINAVKKK
jgi:SAM-dependent methyltransferase